MKKNKLILGIVGMVLLIGGASILYNYLKDSKKNQLAQVTPTINEPTIAIENQDESNTAEDATDEATNQLTDFTVYDSEGNKVQLSDFVGKPIVLNFWASWCGPCKVEMPEFDAMYQEKKDEVHVLMVNLTDGNRETVEKATEYVNEEGFTFPVYFDKDMSAAIAYQVYSIPTTYFFDETGSLVTYAMGTISKEDLQTGIELIMPQD